jgi:hypothetical protein
MIRMADGDRRGWRIERVDGRGWTMGEMGRSNCLTRMEQKRDRRPTTDALRGGGIGWMVDEMRGTRDDG